MTESSDYESLLAQVRDIGARMTVAKAMHQVDAEHVIQLAAECVPHAQACALTVIDKRQRPRTVAASSELPIRVDELQYRTGQGPCLEAIVEDDLTRADDLATDRQWPEFAKQAVEETPVRSMFSVRMFLDADNRAALNFYATTPHAFDVTDIAIGALFSSFAALAIQAERDQERADHLTQALDSNRHVGTAMGILMARQLCTSEEAFALLRNASQSLHLKLVAIAEDVIRTGALPELPPARTREERQAAEDRRRRNRQSP
jgi:GAF domain-containing protein